MEHRLSTQDPANVTANAVGIPTEDGTKNVDPELLKGYRDAAFTWLHDETKAKTGFKELVGVVAETLGLPKGLLTKWFKAQYKAETNKQKDLAASFEALDNAVQN